MILDSGDRTEYSTGAVRDMKKGKGRVDLMPLDVISDLLDLKFFKCMEEFKNNQDDTTPLFEILEEYSYMLDKLNIFSHDKDKLLANMLLEVSKHFEEGALKYGEDNWKKGIEVKSYIDSACRHFLKYLRGDNDESHERACMWNIICLIWTVKNKEKLGMINKNG